MAVKESVETLGADTCVVGTSRRENTVGLNDYIYILHSSIEMAERIEPNLSSFRRMIFFYVVKLKPLLIIRDVTAFSLTGDHMLSFSC